MLRPLRILNYLAFAKSLDIDPSLVLEGSGIDVSRLGESEYLIEAEQCRTVIENLIQASGNQGVGIDVGSRSDMVSLGITGYAMVTCAVMRETLDVWAQYSRPLLGMISRYEMEDAPNGDVTINFVEPSPSDPIFIFSVEELLSLTCHIGKLECGVRPGFKLLELPYPPPPYRQRYDDLFCCPIVFNASRARLIIDGRWVRLPLLTSDDEFHRLCLAHCGHILARIERTSPVATRLREAFLASPQRLPSLEACAQILCMSSRTLRRRLSEEGQSYQALVRDFRADLAREYLRTTSMAIKEISFLLGFDDSQAFRRAFRSWTGLSPGQYRENVLGTDGK